MKRKYVLSFIIVIVLTLGAILPLAASNRNGNENQDYDGDSPTKVHCCINYESSNRSEREYVRSGYINLDQLGRTQLSDDMLELLELLVLLETPKISYVQYSFVERIYLSDHIFGVDEFLDEVFKHGEYGRLFYDIHTIVTEYRAADTFAAFSASCRPGQHISTMTLSESTATLHHMWNFQGGHCTRVTSITWICLFCDTIGTERRTSLFLCFNC